MPNGRRLPYSSNGVKRVVCHCCNKQKAMFQWAVCALGNRHIPVCADCDYHLNMLVLVALGIENPYPKLKEYAERVKDIQRKTRRRWSLEDKRPSGQNHSLDNGRMGNAVSKAKRRTKSWTSDGSTENGVANAGPTT